MPEDLALQHKTRPKKASWDETLAPWLNPPVRSGSSDEAGGTDSGSDTRR